MAGTFKRLTVQIHSNLHAIVIPLTLTYTYNNVQCYSKPTDIIANNRKIRLLFIIAGTGRCIDLEIYDLDVCIFMSVCTPNFGLLPRSVWPNKKDYINIF